jgi:hypothetical protein
MVPRCCAWWHWADRPGSAAVWTPPQDLQQARPDLEQPGKLLLAARPDTGCRHLRRWKSPDAELSTIPHKCSTARKYCKRTLLPHTVDRIHFAERFLL